MAFKWIYFLVWLLCVVAVLDQVQAASQLRIVNGLLIIEDNTPLEVTKGKSQNLTSGSFRAALREGRNHDLHGHGYLNRAASLRSSQRRLLRDGQSTTTTPSPPISPVPTDNSIDESSVLILNLLSESQTNRVDDPTTGQPETESPTTDNAIADPQSKDSQIDKKLFSKFDHTTAVTSVTSPTMDVITIVWYFSTFIALVAFFVVMVCSDKYCTRGSKPEETVVSAPSTPAPSYREFAPPSYDSVMRKQKNRVFIIPMLNESGELKVPDEHISVAVPGASPTLLQVEVQKHNQSTEDHQRRRDAGERTQEKAPAYESSVAIEVSVVHEGQGTDKSASASDDHESR